MAVLIDLKLGKAPDLENDLKEDIQLRRVEEQQLLPDREG